MDKIREEVRLVIAIALSLLIVFAFGKFRAPQKQIGQETPPVVLTEDISDTPLEQKVVLPISVKKTGEDKVYEDNRYIIEYNSAGGAIKNIGIKQYTRANEAALNIFDGSDLLLAYSADKPEEVGNVYSSIIKEKTLHFQNISENILIEKVIDIPSEDYTFTTAINFTNKGRESYTLKNYALSTGTLFTSGVRKGYRDREFVPPEIIIKSNKKVFKINTARSTKSAVYTNTEWIALKQRYGMVFMRPESPQKSFITVLSDNNGTNIAINTGFSYDDIEVLAGETKSIKFSFYAGPSDYFAAKSQVTEREVFGTGFFAAMGRFLFLALSYIHRLIPNWGWAIIILTLIVKAVFFPLTRKSLRSMKALQKLRPYLQDVQKKYKDNPQQMQKELMNLYKEYNINPFGGCLPMFIQFPIFIGFFIALRNSVFLRGAPFILWIQDLSVADTLVRISGFPINLLPIIMAAASFYQQRLTPQEPSQKAMTYMMPIMFLFLFYNFSSGLLLYWTTMNIAGVVEQYYVHKK